jgi:hypothetical protein
LSLHAHIIFWLHPEDLASVSDDVMAYIPATYDKGTKTFIEPSDPLELRLFKLVVCKQIHNYKKKCYINVRGYKYWFLFSVNEARQARLNPYIQCWEYYRPKHCDWNVVLYYATLLLLWGAHINVQRITSSYWSYYLLKYIMKSESYGTLNIDTSNTRRLGLDNMDPVQLQIISTMVTAKLVTSTKAAMTCLGIPIVQRSNAVVYIDPKPPNMRTNYITKNRTLSIHSIVTYTHKHPNFEHLPFKPYLKKYELVKDCFISNLRTYVGVDGIRNYLYKNTKVITFTNYNPLTDAEHFFYKVLLQHIPIRDESELFISKNTRHSYILEYKLRGLLDDIDSLFHYD